MLRAWGVTTYCLLGILDTKKGELDKPPLKTGR